MRAKKNNSIKITGLLLAVSTGILAYAFSTGITGYTLKPGDNGDGCFCHNQSPGNAVSVQILGPERLEPGKTEDYEIIITGGPLAAGGVNIAASAGTLTAGEGLQKIGDELTHQLPRQASGGEVRFEFSFTAPQDGEVTIWATGNSVNFNGQNTQDQWNFAPNKVITVEAATGVDDFAEVKDFRLEQNYPNPFNPETKIAYNIPEAGEVLLTVYDGLGREIKTLEAGLKEAGRHEVVFSANDLASGLYYYTITAGQHKVTKKMLLIK